MKRIFTILPVLVVLTISSLSAQTFTKVTDPNNPITTTGLPGNYSGAAWVDYNNDGLIDLYTTKTFLFKNLGNGNFETVEGELGKDLIIQTLSNGVTWGDFDNDGDPDCFITGNPSVIYRNDAGIFRKARVPAIDNFDNRGWAAAWGDYDNDSDLDLIVTHPANFIGFPARPSWFIENNGDETFTHKDFDFTTMDAPYTVATWYDYDLDDDIDLFIGSGPAGTSGPDYNFLNKLSETGTADLERITAPPIGMDLQNGQVYNFIDYDNDGDMDGFLTNYTGVNDKFFQNDNGILTSVTKVITTQNQGNNLGNTWGDLDNDGFLDVIVTSDGITNYYRNNGNGDFILTTTPFSLSGNSRAAVLGDYDNDGDLDLFVSGQNSVKGLYRNDTQNGNKWIQFKLTGSVSNRSALGTKIKIKAVVNGIPMWQSREITAQNNFNSHSEFRVHFGLGNASNVDSVIITWPSGQSTIAADLQPDLLYEVEEQIPAGYLNANFTSDKREAVETLTVQFKDVSVFNPSLPVIQWEWDFNNDGTVDATEQNPEYTYTQTGEYTVKLSVSNGTSTETIIKPEFIHIDPFTNVDDGVNTGSSFKLHQNYPNPFNPATVINYAVPEEDFVTLTVYNTLGEVIQTLVSENKKAGSYTVNFDAAGLSNGIYFYKLTSGRYSEVKKMVYLK